MERYILEKRETAQDTFVLMSYVQSGKPTKFAIKRKTPQGNYIPVELHKEFLSDDILIEMEVLNASFECLSPELSLITNSVWQKASNHFGCVLN